MKKVLGFGCALALLGCAGQVNVMTLGVGTGRVRFSPAAADCGPTREVCQRNFASSSTVTMTVHPADGDTFAEWGGDCSGSATICRVDLSEFRAVTARFEPATPLPSLAADSLTGAGVRSFLLNNSGITWTPEKFIAVLKQMPDQKFSTNWILMARSESLQTAHAKSPRLLLPNFSARQVFAFSLSADPASPSADPNIVEYMEWDGVARQFYFHEINLRTGAVTLNDPKCDRCHAGRPNWDAYDSFGGMLPFNRDRVYKGSLEAAALRNMFRLWNQTGTARAILEQLDLPPDMRRNTGGGFNNGRIAFRFDDESATLVEAARANWGAVARVTANYPATAPPSDVFQGGTYFTIRADPPFSDPDAGRGVDMFERFTVLDPDRIAQQLIDHPRTVADVRPIAAAILENCDVQGTLTPAQFAFFSTGSRTPNLGPLQLDTLYRRHLLPSLKADVQLLNLGGPSGLWTGFRSNIAGDTSSDSMRKLRQELFRRDRQDYPVDTITRLMIDRESYLRPASTADDIRVAQLRFYLEPLGVPVDKWSMSVGGRSRTYTFANLLHRYVGAILLALHTDLGIKSTADCSAELMTRLRTELNRLRDIATAPLPAPAYSEVQVIWNRNCMQCHGDFTVNGVAPVAPNLLPGSSFAALTGGRSPPVIPNNVTGSRLWQRITGAGGAPLMPPAANGPPLSGAHIRIIERWIAASAPSR